MGRAPILYVDGTAIAQSKTIERFVGRKLGFMGANDIEAAQVDAICEHVADIKKTYSDCKVGKKDEELAAAKAKWIGETFPEWCAKLEKCLGGNGFAIGSKLSLADLVIFSIVELVDDKAGAESALNANPKLAASLAATKAAAAGWIAKRPDTKF